VFVTGKLFQSGLIFACKAGAYLMKGTPLLIWLLAFPANIRPGWKVFQWTNTLTYLALSKINGGMYTTLAQEHNLNLLFSLNEADQIAKWRHDNHHNELNWVTQHKRHSGLHSA